MNLFRRTTTTDTEKDQEGGENAEAKIREFMRREGPRADESVQSNHEGVRGNDVAPRIDSDVVAHNVGYLLQRVSLNSVQEIDRLIDELKVLSEQLQQESARIQREIGEYATLSQAAMQSTKIIADSLTQWRAPTGAPDAAE